MPRGNDPTASRDLANQYGDGHGNAEDLIRTHDDRLDEELNRALLKPVDPAATDALDLESIKPKFDGTIMSAVIRGGRLVVVEDVDGHYVKWHDDPPGGKAKSSGGGSRSRSRSGGSRAKGGSKGGSRVDSGAQGRKDAAVHGQAENPTGDPDKNDGGTGATGGQAAGSTSGATPPPSGMPGGTKPGGSGAPR